MGATGTLSNATMALVGGTYFPHTDSDNGVRYECIKQFLAKMRDINASDHTAGQYPVIIADASPGDIHDELRSAFKRLGAIVLDARLQPGIGSQNQLAIRCALEQAAPLIMRTELEKYGLANGAVLSAITDRMLQGDVDILCIGRGPGGAYESLPLEQQDSERIMSRAVASLGLPEDSACGLRALSRSGANLVCGFDTARYGNQWQFLWYCMLDAIVSGMAVDGLFVELIHPVEMTALESRNPVYLEKRVDQAAMLIPAIVAYAGTRGIRPNWDPQRQWVI